MVSFNFNKKARQSHKEGVTSSRGGARPIGRGVDGVGSSEQRKFKPWEETRGGQLMLEGGLTKTARKGVKGLVIYKRGDFKSRQVQEKVTKGT